MKRLLRYGLLVLGCCLTAACSDGSDIYSPDAPEDNTDKSAMSGYYNGVWALDDVTVSADPLALSTPCPSYVFMGFDPTPYLSFVEFPYKAITKTIYPDIDIAKITSELPYGASITEEQRLLERIDSLYKSRGDDAVTAIYSTRLRYVGYSKNITYLELVSFAPNAYLHYTFVVTTTSGDYFGVVLDVATTRTQDAASKVSTVSMDMSLPSMSLMLVVRSLNCFNKNLDLMEKTFTPEKLVRFNSNRKSVGIIYK